MTPGLLTQRRKYRFRYQASRRIVSGMSIPLADQNSAHCLVPGHQGAFVLGQRRTGQLDGGRWRVRRFAAGDDGDGDPIGLVHQGHRIAHARPIQVARDLLHQARGPVALGGLGGDHVRRGDRDKTRRGGRLDQEHIPIGQGADFRLGNHPGLAGHGGDGAADVEPARASRRGHLFQRDGQLSRRPVQHQALKPVLRRLAVHRPRVQDHLLDPASGPQRECSLLDLGGRIRPAAGQDRLPLGADDVDEEPGVRAAGDLQTQPIVLIAGDVQRSEGIPVGRPGRPFEPHHGGRPAVSQLVREPRRGCSSSTAARAAR